MHLNFYMSTTFNYLDDTSFRSLYCIKDNGRRMKFYIEGIRCGKCVSKIEGIVSEDPEIKSVEVDIAHQIATVEMRDSSGSFALVAECIESLGFKPVPLRPEYDSTESWNLETRKDLVRLATAAFCAGNIMMLAFSIYFGLEGNLRRNFEWLQFFLYLPVVSYVAIPFYKGFFQGIKNHTLSIDGPMAIASFLGFCISTWNLVKGTGSIYFDSTSGFLFLILATRYWQKSARREYLKFLSPISLMDTFKARLKNEEGLKWIPSNQLLKNQIVIVEKNEWIPADGILLSDSAVLDLSLLDGESRPRLIRKGFPLKAGTRLVSDNLEMEVSTSGAQTMLGQLLNSLNINSIEKTDSSTLSNKASQWLMGTVLILASATMFVGVLVDFNLYFERAFALLVLACPCAMAFGTPLAFSFSMKRAQEMGILIKSANVFEKIKSIRTIFVDKTGTLTGKSWEITDSSLESVPLFFKEIILSLEATSQHPVAYALRELWFDVPANTSVELEMLRSLPNGMEAVYEGETWRFCSFDVEGTKWFGLFKDRKLLWQFQLKSQLRSQVNKFISNFKSRGFRIMILSGDSHDEARRIGQLLEVEPRDIFSNLTAFEKAEMVKTSSNSMMIGDGVNDALALQAASVGIAVQGSVDMALKSADVLLMNENLDSIENLFEIARQARRQIKRNLTMALIYNVAGGAAALLGFVNPFVAALLMPISSVCILAATWIGTRR